MATVSDYTFNKLGRIGDDACCIDQSSVQNVESCNYTLQNYFTKDCNMNNLKAIATAQPGVNYSGAHGMAVGGCNVEDSSNLLIGSIQTASKCRIDLFQRPFATVPFLGRGNVDPMLEFQVQSGESVTNKRTVTKLTEKNHLKYRFTPMIPKLKRNVQNPANLIEESASEGWIKGGVPSRELTRDKDYYKFHTAQQYI